MLVRLAAGTGLGAAFVVVELRRQAPMLDPRLLRRPDFAAATVGALVTGGGVIALLSFLPTLVQRGLGHSALVAALVLLPWSVPTVAARAGPLLPGAAHPRIHLVGGLLVVAAAQALLAGVDPETGLPTWCRLLLAGRPTACSTPRWPGRPWPALRTGAAGSAAASTTPPATSGPRSA